MKGFTLIELVLIGALVGILAIAAIPRLVTAPTGLDAAARKIQSDIRYSQFLAMHRGIPHGIEYRAGTPYVLYEGTPVNPIVDPLTRQSFSEDLRRFGGTRILTDYQVEFDRMGRPVVGGGGMVTIANGNEQRTIRVAPNTGYVFW